MSDEKTRAEAGEEQAPGVNEEHEEHQELEGEAGQAAAAEGQAAGEEASSGDDPSPEQEIERLRERLARVEKDLSEADVRAQAEIQNVRRRAERDVEQAHKFALEKFAAEIVNVADSLERALDTLDENDEAVRPAREGTELTLKALLDVFARFNIEQIDPRGETFNPEQHEAMTMVSSAEAEPNTVVDVLEKGYLLNGRVIRPARVVVAKAPEGS